VKSKIPNFDIKRGESRGKFFKKLWAKQPGGDLKTNADYDAVTSLDKIKKYMPSLSFNKMMDRSVVNSIYYRSDPIKDDYAQSRINKAISATSKRNGSHIIWDKQKKRDMSMYRQTEALRNIENENERYRMLQQILSGI
jgi:hypothetical protein